MREGIENIQVPYGADIGIVAPYNANISICQTWSRVPWSRKQLVDCGVCQICNKTQIQLLIEIRFEISSMTIFVAVTKGR